MTIAHRYCSSSLHNGDCMTQKQFHELYESAPEGFRAELIGGVVFVCEPLGLPHADHHVRLSSILDAYRSATRGVEVFDSPSVFLSDEDEVQPDLVLRISPEYGGRSTNADKGMYVSGAPELVVEVAHSSRAIDLHVKKRRYANAGVLEYIVLCLEPLDLRWFRLHDEQWLSRDRAGTFRSIAFPGLWINEPALLQMDYAKTMRILNNGLKSKEHQAFVKHLAASKK